MKKMIVVSAFLLAAGSLFAGEGKSCQKSEVKSVELTGTMACADGEKGDDCARVFRLDDGTNYTVCEKTRASLTSITGAKVRVTGKVVSCGEGKELLIEKSAKI